MPDYKTLIISALVRFRLIIMLKKTWKLEPVPYFSALQSYNLYLIQPNKNAKKIKKSPIWRLFILFIKLFID